MGVNSLPKTDTRQRRDCDQNPGPSAPESRTLTTRLPSHPQTMHTSTLCCFLVLPFLIVSTVLITINRSSDQSSSLIVNHGKKIQHFADICHRMKYHRQRFCLVLETHNMTSITCVADMPRRRRLRSASTEQLDVPTCRRSTIGGRAFPVAGAKVWNGLPSDVTSASSLSVFKNRLKTYLFRRCYETV